jgi:Family of unknown function (DUF5682)
MTFTIFGVRHHGPGSARSLVQDLERLAPDCLLIEGPPDANALIDIAADKKMKPPVALLVYDPAEPRDAAFFPFAVFSPEWQAIQIGLKAGIPVRFIDLSVGYQLAMSRAERDRLLAELAERPPDREADVQERDVEALMAEGSAMRTDPLGELARAAGEPDGERWWDRLVESRRTAADVFEAVTEAMTAVRTELPHEDPRTMAREAAMRRELRAAARDGFQTIAVVCGAWHVPALVDRPSAAADDRVLRALPKAVRTTAAWVPWTYGRLAVESGYGAGIESPGWYEHLWSGREPLAVSWMARVARVFRGADLDISAAHLIEATRLAETLAALRGRALPSLHELNEAVRSVATFGNDVPMALVRDELIVGRRMGSVPESAPIAPLAADLAREQRRLRLRPEEARKTIDLDLRGAIDLARSHLLHRLGILGVHWGTPERAYGKSGTFHELWQLAWKPDFVVDLIAASRYGTTILDAASARAIEASTETDRLPALTELVEAVLLADLSTAVEPVVDRIGSIAALSADVPSLMAALPPLARVVRYGNVRGTDASAVRTVVDGLVARICVGLLGACVSLDDDAASDMLPLLDGTDSAVGLVDDPDHRAAWRATMDRLADQANLHGLIAGRAARLLVDARALAADEAILRMSRSLSRGSEPGSAAAWLEGFLRDSGLILVHDDALFGVVDGWVSGLSTDSFDVVLPLLRRTVATFSPAERRAIGERAGQARATEARSGMSASDGSMPGTYDPERAALVMPILATILGLDEETPR